MTLLSHTAPLDAAPRRVPSPAAGADSLATVLAQLAATDGGRPALTFVDHRHSVDGHAVTLSRRELDARVEAVAVRLAEHAQPGDRAAVLLGQSADWVVTFLAAIRAGLVAVPLFPPSLPGHGGRLAAVLADCEAIVLATDPANAADVDALITAHGLPGRSVVIDGCEPVPAEPRAWPEPRGDDLAYLQYTSGSTRTPAGVLLTHDNVLTNSRQMADAYGVTDAASAVSWLPLYHDMGLVVGIGVPLVAGIPTLLMEPKAFLAEPVRWLRAMAASPGAFTAAPNFAYGFAAARVTAAEAATLDLSRVVAMVDGSEPLQTGSVERFIEAFAPYGLAPSAHRPSYGLAEATVFVAASPAGSAPRAVAFDRDLLATGRAVPAGPGAAAVRIYSVGHPGDQRVCIVDDGAVAGPGEVGEIWVSGPNVGGGYWGRPEQSAEVFDRWIGDDPDPWMATGDLGVLVDGELFITGRIKDLVIVDGRNHYPQDIEHTAERDPLVRLHSPAVFALPTRGGEAAVLAVELSKDAPEGADLAAFTSRLRGAIAAEHGLNLRDVVVLQPGQVPRTTSGKISRSAARARYLDGTFTAGRLA